VVDEIVYALANGIGKQRANRAGGARPVTRWRCITLSSGERTLETIMADAGIEAKAGQLVRCLNIESKREILDSIRDLARRIEDP
jgi:putative DNA primase/helicase